MWPQAYAFSTKKMSKKLDKELFWDTLEHWADNSGTNAELYDTVPSHKVEEMLQECKDFEAWDIPEKSDTPVQWPIWPPPPGSTEEEKKALNEALRKAIANTRTGSSLATPLERPKDFPVICKFIEENRHRYGHPIVSKLAPQGVIAPHQHKLKRKGRFVVGRFLYNLCLNFPEGCRFAVHPTGLVPYRPGDIYKLNAHAGLHSVVNNSNEDRYHIMIRPVNHRELVEAEGIEPTT